MDTKEVPYASMEVGPPAGGSAYDGFMSYSHAADGLLAPRLQAGLQRFAKPWWKRRALRIFRDEASLSANPHLWSSIVEAIDRSDWLVLLLSEDAAASEWVDREVRWWLDHKNAARIIPVVTDGEFSWAAGDIASSSTAAPPALSGAFAEEPRWVDLRWARSDTQLDLRNARFRDAVADIASALREVPKEDLESEEVVQHRRTIRTAWGAATTLMLLVVFAVAAAVFAFDQRSEARRQAQLAEDQAAIAVAEAEARAAEAEARLEAEQRADEAETRLEERRGSLDTPLGTVSFFRVSGEAGSIPDGPFWETSDGYLALAPRPPDAPFDVERPFELWQSQDLQTWVPFNGSDLPPLRRFEGEGAGLAWFSSDDPSSWWATEDFETWTEWSIPDAPIPDISGLSFEQQISPYEFASIGNSVLIPVDVVGSVDFAELLGIPADDYFDVYGYWDELREVLQVVGFNFADGDTPLGALTVDVVGEAELRLSDADTGNELLSISIGDGSTTATELRDQLLARGGFSAVSSLSLAVAEAGGDIEYRPAPWPATPTYDRYEVGTLGDAVFVYVTQGEAVFGPYDVWTSNDGLSWERAGEVFDDDRDFYSVVEGRGVLFATVEENVNDPFAGSGSSTWASFDGLNWEPVLPNAGSADVQILDSAYAVADSSGVRLSTDGVDWHTLDSDELAYDVRLPEGGGGSGAWTVRNQLLVQVTDDASNLAFMWVFAIEPTEP